MTRLRVILVGRDPPQRVGDGAGISGRFGPESVDGLARNQWTVSSGIPTAWEADRAELDTLRQEIADAYEKQARELEAVSKALETAQAEAKQQAQHQAEALSRAERAEARLGEIERWVHELREELNRAQAEADRLRAGQAEARERAATLSGQLEALSEQNAQLLVRISPLPAPPKQ